MGMERHEGEYFGGKYTRKVQLHDVKNRVSKGFLSCYCDYQSANQSNYILYLK